MTKFWKKVAGLMLVGALVLGGSVTAMAAPAETAPKAEQAGKVQAFRHLRDQIKTVHAKIVTEREQLKANLDTIRRLVEALKQDPDKNRPQLEKAKVALRELQLLNQNRKQVNEQLQAAVEAFKAAVEAKDYDAAMREGARVLSLMQTKLDLLRAANNKAAEAIAHLKAAD